MLKAPDEMKAQDSMLLRAGVQTGGAIASIIALIVMVIGGVIAGVVIRMTGIFGVENGDLIQVFVSLAVFALVALLVSFVILLRAWQTKESGLGLYREQYKLNRSLDDQDEIHRMMEALMHEAALNQRRLALRIRNLSNDDANSELILQRIVGNWRKFSQEYINISRKIMERATGESCSLCIKLLGWSLEPGRQPTVQTLIRDDINKRNRKYSDGADYRYPASSNTAFNQLLHDPTFERVFVCNELDSSETYLNTNEHWQRFYNATLVTRIGSEHFQIRQDGHDQSLGYDMIGFLCADSQHADLDNERCANLMKCLASLYNEYLNTVARLYFALDLDARERLLSTEQDPVNAKRLQALMTKIDEATWCNRPLGVMLKRNFDADGRAVGIHTEKTPMIIHRMFREWQNYSMP